MDTESEANYSVECSSTDPVDLFNAWTSKYPNIAVATAAIQALTSVVRNSTSSTLMGLQIELRKAGDAIQKIRPTSISLAAGCQLFGRYVTRTSLDCSFDECKQRLIERGIGFAAYSLSARRMIASLSEGFIRDGQVILVHGHSRVLNLALLHANSLGKRISVIIPEARPSCVGYLTAKELRAGGIPVTIICDTAIAHRMAAVDLVLTGAEGVVESGGIVNGIGSYQVALCAKALKKPFYVFSESYKFARLFPLSQEDLPERKSDQAPFVLARNDVVSSLPPGTEVDNPTYDYTPPEYITLLFTDLGILTPSAVSDELIKLYN